MPKKPPSNSPKCPFCGHKSIKWGYRKNKFSLIQRYLCKNPNCNKSFLDQPSLQTNKTYSLKTILQAISAYNLGQPLRKQEIPSSTIHNWLSSFPLPFNRLRDKIKNIPKHNIIIKKRFIHHNQPFLYQYHSLKLEFAKKFPALITYLKEINKSLPKQIFENSERISQAKKIIPNINLRKKQNYAVKLAEIALQIINDNRQRHNIIENFMLINDTATIATEIPVYLNQPKPLTGHIDILQLRYHKLHILDYKPEPINKRQAITQLLLYREALSKRTSIPEYKFKLAFFNNKGYYEIG
ncbi:MAG: hypothetical protein KAK00_03265 [Nanoarchaeota archaeon]|nr:hypothetical protein [Nanoarchaeota archaeon]